MFNIANKISLWTAGISAGGLKNIIGAESASNELSAPAKSSLFAGIFGGLSWGDVGATIWSAFMQFFYVVIRFCLNIVDFLQFFVKHLVGIDYWENGDVSLDTLGDSDIIFKFLYNSTVQRVFKYMLGLFVVLLILFAIIAIVKSEYAVAMETDKAEVNALKVLKNCGKAILMVVLVPLLLVMGILASNAVLAGLVNTLNVNNHLSLGNQVFTSSAYDANRYRTYAKNGIRYSITNDINIELDGVTYSIKSSVDPVVPKNYTTDSPFTGFAFNYKDKYYLYYVDMNTLLKTCGTHTVYDYYVEYFINHLGVSLATYETFNTTNVVGKPYIIKSALNTKAQGSGINQAAYNSWIYNSILNNNKTTFDKTLTYDLYSKVNGMSYTTDSGNTYADAKVYRNSNAWAAIHDGGKYGLVTLPDEYYVMGDIIDFVVGDVAEVAYVNALNPLIDWEYSDDASGYLSSKFVQFNYNSSKTAITGIKSFVVNYKDSGMVVYQPKDQSRESLGAVYIMAYYSAASNRYIPIVNGKSYTDDYGNAHKFSSDYLDSNYNGLIVARGILEQTAWKNICGYPTEITAEFDKGLNGETVNTETEYYYTSSVQQKSLSTKTIIDLDATLNSNQYIDTATGSSLAKLIPNEVADITTTEGRNLIKDSLVKSFTYRTLIFNGIVTDPDTGVETPQYVNGQRTISEIEWTLSGDPISVVKAGGTKTTYVFASNKTIEARVDNENFTENYQGTNPNLENVNKNYNLPLYAFVEIVTNSDGTHSTNVKYVYAQYQYADQTFFQNINSSKTINEESTSKNIYTASYSFEIGNHGLYSGNGIVAKSLNIRENLALGTTGEDVSCYIVASSLSYDSERKTFSTDKGKILAGENIQTEERYGDIVNSSVLKLCKEIDGNLISGRVQLSYANNATNNNLGTSQTVNGVFKELSDSSVQNGNLTIYQFALYETANDARPMQVQYKYRYEVNGKTTLLSKSTPIIVTVCYNSDDQTVSIYANDVMTLVLGGEIVLTSGDPYATSLYDMDKYAEETSGSSTIYKYRKKINDQYYYTDYLYSVYNGVVTLSNISTSLYEVTVNTYNMFTYVKDGTLKQYNPVTSSDNQTVNPISISKAYVRSSSLRVVSQAIRNGEYIYRGYIYLENNDNSATANGTLFASFYTSVKYEVDEEGNPIIPTLTVQDAINDSYRFDVGSNEYQKVPVYTNAEIDTQLKAASATIYFKRQYVSGGQTYFDFDFGILFLNGKSWRVNLVFTGTSDTKINTSSFRIVGSRFKFDYNFVSTTALGLELKIFYLPSALNIVILAFATGLLISILGKAVWGLIQRIFDITVYFIVLPGITATYPLDDGKKFGAWKDTVVKKVLSAYGVMLGLNIFFILCPAIKSVSHLFTVEDMNQLSSGNVLAGVSPGTINSICEVMFMLVALTMIQTLPGLIAGLVGGEDAVAVGEATKKNKDKMLSEAGKTITGANALDAVLGKYDEKKGKRTGGMVGQLKNFVPGSAIYDDVKKKMDKAKADKPQKSSAEVADGYKKKAAAAAAEAARKASEKLTGMAENAGGNKEEEKKKQEEKKQKNDNKEEEKKKSDSSDTSKSQIDLNNDGGANPDGETPKQPSDEKKKEEKQKNDKKQEPKQPADPKQPSDGKKKEEKQKNDNKQEPKQPADPKVLEKIAELQNKIAEMDQILSKINISKLEQEINDLKQKRDEAQNSNKFVKLYEDLRQTLINKSSEFRGKDTEAQNAELDRIIAEGKYGNSSKGYANQILREIGQLGMTFDNSNNKASKVYSDLSKKKAESSALISDIDKKIVDKQKQIDAGGDAELAKLQTNVEQKQKAVDEIDAQIDKNNLSLAAVKAYESLKNDKSLNQVRGYIQEYTRNPAKFEKEKSKIYKKYSKEFEVLREYAKQNKLGNGSISHAVEEINTSEIESENSELAKSREEKVKDLETAQTELDQYKTSKEAYRSEIATKAENIDQNSMNKIIEEMKAQLDDARGKINKLLLDAADAKIREVESYEKDLNESSQTNINLERARLYAEAAQKASEAARIYSDIASGNLEQYAPETGKKRKSSLEKDYDKLSELLNERSKRLEDQENGKIDLAEDMGDLDTINAYLNFNKKHEQIDSIIDWLGISNKEKDELKKKKSLDLYNQKHGTALTELDKKQQKEANKLLDTDQKVLQDIARKEFKDDELDRKIEKVQQRIALRESGLYVNPVVKVAKDVGAFLIGNREMTEKQRQKFAAKAAEAEKKGLEITDKLNNLDDIIAKDKADLMKKDGLVFGANGKVDRKASEAAGYGKNKSKKQIKKDFDEIDSKLESIENGTYKDQLEKQLQSQLNKQRAKFDRYTAQKNNDRFGWSQSFAANLSSGARAVRTHFENKGVQKAERKVETAIEKMEKKATLVERKEHGGKKFTNKQAQTLDGLKRTLGSDEVALRNEARKYGINSVGNIDEIGREIQKRIQSETVDGKQPSDQLKGLLDRFTQYSAARRNYNSTLAKYSYENQQSYLGHADLKEKRIKAAEARKAQLARQLAEAKKSGRLSSAEEDKYIEEISNYEKKIKSLDSSYQKYKKPGYGVTKTMKFKGALVKAKDFAAKVPSFVQKAYANKVKPAKLTHQELARRKLASTTYVGARKTQIQTRDDENLTKVTEKVSKIRVRQADNAAGLTENAQRSYVEKVIKALSKSGNAGLIKQITSATTPEAAAIAAKRASEQAIQTLEARRKEIQKEMRNAGSQTRAEDLKAQEKVVSATLKKLRTASNAEQVATQMAKSSAMKAQSEAAVSAAIRSAYKEQWNKFVANNGLRSNARSGSAAYEANKALKKELTAQNSKLQNQIAELRKNAPTSSDISRLTSMIDSNNLKLYELAKMNKDAEVKAKKALKKTTSIESIMKDMRRASKYKIPGMNKPTGSN